MTSTAFDLSAADFAAIEFYEEHRAAVEAYGLLSIFGEDRDDRRQFNKGKKLIAAAIDAARKTTAKRIPYTDQEVQFLFATYLKKDAHMRDTLEAFFAAFPDTEHTRSSVWQKIQRIRTLDNAYPEDTAWDLDQQTASIGAAMSPRFAQRVAA